jgi:hypothetical protein
MITSSRESHVSNRPGQGRVKADGAKLIKSEFEKLIQTHRSELSVGYQCGPPTASTWEAFLALWEGERFPPTCLNPEESWEEELRPIGELDLEWAEAVCHWLASGHSEVWLRRNWDGWPGDRTWKFWRRNPRVREMIQEAEEKISRVRQEESERQLGGIFRRVERGDYDAKLAMAVMNGARYVAEQSQKFAEKRSPQRYGQHLNVETTVHGRVIHDMSAGTQHLIEEIRATHGMGPLIEGQVDGS